MVTSRYHLCRSTDYFHFLPTCTISYVRMFAELFLMFRTGESPHPPGNCIWMVWTNLWIWFIPVFFSPAYVQGPRIFIYIYIYRDRNSHNSHHVHTLDLNLGWIPPCQSQVCRPSAHSPVPGKLLSHFRDQRPSTCIRE